MPFIPNPIGILRNYYNKNRKDDSTNARSQSRSSNRGPSYGSSKSSSFSDHRPFGHPGQYWIKDDY